MDKKQKLYLIVFFVGISAGMIGATQYVGWAYDYNPLLGWSIIRLPGFTIYCPLAFLVWSITLYNNSLSVINDAGMILIACMMAPFLLAVIMTRKGRVVKEFGKEAWGNIEDAKAAGIYIKQPAGTIIGFWRDRKQLLSYNGPEHQLVAGASRAGKGAGHVIPTLLNWPESVVVYDPKAECYDITAEWRSKFSNAFFLNFTRRDSVSFNPLSEVRRGDSELADVQNIVQILFDPSGTKDEPNFFDTVACTLLASVILHQLYTAPDAEKNLAAVRMRLMNLPALIAEMTTSAHRHKRDFTKPDGMARDQEGALIPEAIPEIRNTGLLFAGMAERLQSDLSTTAFSYLNVFSDPIVAEKTSSSDFTFGDLVCSEHPVSCYIQTPPSDAYRLRPLTRLFLSQMAKSLMTDPSKDAAGRKKNHKLLFLIDEFPSLGKLGFFSDNLRVMAGYGIKAMLIVQSFKDIVSAYGPANTIVDNCHITIAFAAADDDSCQKISHMAGRAVEYRAALSEMRKLGGFMSGSDSRSYSEQQRNILEPGDVRSLPYDEQLIFVTGSKPYRTKKIRYWEDGPFAGRATNIRKGGHGPDQSKGADLPGETVARNPWIGVKAIGAVSSSGLPEAAEPRQENTLDRSPLTNEADVLNAAGALGIDLSCFEIYGGD